MPGDETPGWMINAAAFQSGTAFERWAWVLSWQGHCVGFVAGSR